MKHPDENPVPSHSTAGSTETTASPFTPFARAVSISELPDRFTFPFNYSPHPLCLEAAHSLQARLQNTDFDHDFGIDSIGDQALGKMFGVLVVMCCDNTVGFLSGYSGKIGERNDHEGFVPPIVDLLDPEGFYKQGEAEVSALNRKIEEIENNAERLSCLKRLTDTEKRTREAIEQLKNEFKRKRSERRAQRAQAESTMSAEVYRDLFERHKRESLNDQYLIKKTSAEAKERIDALKADLDEFDGQLSALKNERRRLSAALQQEIFSRFRFLNFNGDEKDLGEIFRTTAQKTAPAGAGECALPKLLQYAYRHGMKPLAFAEFWWGRSPESEIRRHGEFYPSCRGKCEPILGHMLEGLQIENNPAHTIFPDKHKIEILYDDEYMLAANKPAELLTLPGKTVSDSLITRLKEEGLLPPEALAVHRLDMSTSGIVLFAKSLPVHYRLQRQFIGRTIQKCYLALLDGEIAADSGLIDLPLRVDLDNRPRQLVCFQYGKTAQTRYKVIGRKDGRTRVLFFPLTGRTHQLRVHAAHHKGLGTPIVGDDLYGRRNSRLHLHALTITFTHPVSKKKMTLKSEAPF